MKVLIIAGLSKIMRIIKSGECILRGCGAFVLNNSHSKNCWVRGWIIVSWFVYLVRSPDSFYQHIFDNWFFLLCWNQSTSEDKRGNLEASRYSITKSTDTLCESANSSDLLGPIEYAPVPDHSVTRKVYLAQILQMMSTESSLTLWREMVAMGHTTD